MLLATASGHCFYKHVSVGEVTRTKLRTQLTRYQSKYQTDRSSVNELSSRYNTLTYVNVDIKGRGN